MSLFDLPMGPADPSDGVSGMYYTKVEPTQAISTGAAFGSQNVEFIIQPAVNEWLVPSRSYFRLRVKVEGKNGDDSDYISIGATKGTTSTTIRENTFPAFGLCARLFNTCKFSIGGQAISAVNNNLPQVDAIHKRTTLSRTQLESSEGLYQALAADRKKQFLGEDAASVTTTTSELTWQPPLGIHDVPHALPASKFQWSFTANPNFVRDSLDGGDAVEIPTDNSATSGRVSVESMVLYACFVSGRAADDEKYSLNLKQFSAQTQQMSKANQSLQLKTFDVSQDTSALAFALQTTSNENKYGGKGLFRMSGTEQNKIARWYLQYDNKQYPAEQSEDFRDTTSNLMTQRWRDTQSQTGMYFSPGGPETEFDWLYKRGGYYYVNWPRTQSSATRVQANVQLSSGPVPTDDYDLLLFSLKSEAYLVRSGDGRVRKIEAAE